MTLYALSITKKTNTTLDSINNPVFNSMKNKHNIGLDSPKFNPRFSNPFTINPSQSNPENKRALKKRKLLGKQIKKI